jgi:hypothetical protein
MGTLLGCWVGKPVWGIPVAQSRLESLGWRHHPARQEPDTPLPVTLLSLLLKVVFWRPLQICYAVRTFYKL